MHIVTTPKRLNDDCSICQPQQEHCELLPIWWCWIKELFNSYMFLKCNDMFWPVRYSILGVSLFSTLKFSSENAHCNLALNAVGFGAKKPFLFVTGQCGIGESHGSRLLFWKSHVWVYIILILTYICIYIYTWYRFTWLLLYIFCCHYQPEYWVATFAIPKNSSGGPGIPLKLAMLQPERWNFCIMHCR